MSRPSSLHSGRLFFPATGHELMEQALRRTHSAAQVVCHTRRQRYKLPARASRGSRAVYCRRSREPAVRRHWMHSLLLNSSSPRWAAEGRSMYLARLPASCDTVADHPAVAAVRRQGGAKMIAMPRSSVAGYQCYAPSCLEECRFCLIASRDANQRLN